MQETIDKMKYPIFHNSKIEGRLNHQQTSCYMMFVDEYLKQGVTDINDVKFNFILTCYHSDVGIVEINENNIVEFMNCYLKHPCIKKQIVIKKPPVLKTLHECMFYLAGLEFKNRGTGQVNPYFQRAIFKVREIDESEFHKSYEFFKLLSDTYYSTQNQTNKSTIGNQMPFKTYMETVEY